MPFGHTGEIAALATAVCWTCTSMLFASAGKRVGSLSVNIIRLVIGFAFLSLFCWLSRGRLLPTDATAHNWLWLSLSGAAGFVVGDLCLFRAFVVIGARVSMLLMSLVPPMTALIGWLWLGERLSAADLLGMTLTVAGVSWVVLERRTGENGPILSIPPSGLALGLLGALGQAVGLVMSKIGMGSYSPFASTQIRILTGIAGFAILLTALGWWPNVMSALRNGAAMKRITAGAFFGPFLGVSLSLTAVKYTTAGVAATIMAIPPVLIILPAILILKEKVPLRAVGGALLAVAGVAVLFL